MVRPDLQEFYDENDDNCGVNDVFQRLENEKENEAKKATAAAMGSKLNKMIAKNLGAMMSGATNIVKHKKVKQAAFSSNLQNLLANATTSSDEEDRVAVMREAKERVTRDDCDSPTGANGKQLARRDILLNSTTYNKTQVEVHEADMFFE